MKFGMYKTKNPIWIETKYKTYSKFEFIKTHEFYNGVIFKKDDIVYGILLDENIFLFKRKDGPSICYYEYEKTDTYSWVYGTNVLLSFRKNGPSIISNLQNKPKKYFSFKDENIFEQDYWNM